MWYSIHTEEMGNMREHISEEFRELSGKWWQVAFIAGGLEVQECKAAKTDANSAPPISSLSSSSLSSAAGLSTKRPSECLNFLTPQFRHPYAIALSQWSSQESLSNC